MVIRPKGFSDNSIYCNHANEMPVQCPCDSDCYCRKHGNCGSKEKEAKRKKALAKLTQEERELLGLEGR